MQAEQVLAEDLPLGLVGQLWIAVALNQVLRIEKSRNARSAHGGWQIGASEP